MKWFSAILISGTLLSGLAYAEKFFVYPSGTTGGGGGGQQNAIVLGIP